MPVNNRQNNGQADEAVTLIHSAISYLVRRRAAVGNQENASIIFGRSFQSLAAVAATATTTSAGLEKSEISYIHTLCIIYTQIVNTTDYLNNT